MVGRAVSVPLARGWVVKGRGGRGVSWLLDNAATFRRDDARQRPRWQSDADGI